MIEKLYKIARSAIQSQNFTLNQINLTTHEVGTSLESQILRLSNIRQVVLEVSGELAKLETQFAEFESDLKRETDNSVKHQNSKNILATIESLSVELATMAKEGSSSATSAENRIQEIDKSRLALKSVEPLQALPALLSVWQHEITYRHALGYESNHLNDVNASYRKDIEEVSDELFALVKEWQKRAETLDDEIAVALSRHHQLEQQLSQYYGAEPIEGNAYRDVTACQCVNRKSCDFPKLNLNLVEEHSMTAPKLRGGCEIEYESVWFTFIRLQWKEVPEELGVDDKLKEWLQLAENERLKEKIEVYEVARKMEYISREFSKAGKLAVQNIAIVEFPVHVDMRLKNEVSVEICGSLPGVECLDDLLRQARWWRDEGLKAHHWEGYSAWCQECLLIEDNLISFSISELPKPELACMEMSHSLGTFGCADEKAVQVLFDLLGRNLTQDVKRRLDEPLEKFEKH